ncbi:MAG: metallophosphoesterase family protein [candidate division WOR-3 bacterium]
MKFLIFSDIHSNYDALESVIDFAGKNYQPFPEVICLGDIIGYGAQPNECLEKVFSLTDKVLLGNHECGVIGKTNIRFFNYSAKESILWTKKVIKKDLFEKIKKLDYTLSLQDFKFSHSNLQNPSYWNYITSIYEAEDEFYYEKFKLLFIGHTHIPVVYKKVFDDVKMIQNETIKIEDNSRYIINVGSVGQPRDGDNRASFVVFDKDDMVINFHRVEYDIESAMKKINEERLPKILADRLKEGL